MPTFNEISKNYADRLRAALRSGRFQESVALRKSHDYVQNSDFLSEFKAVAKSVDQDWNVDGVPLTKEQKERIVRGIAEHLGTTESEKLLRAVKSANDSHTDIVGDIIDVIDDIVGNSGGTL